MPRKLTAWSLVFAMASFATPMAAQDVAANTIWGETAGCVADAVTAVLVDLTGRQVATSQVENGRFLFPNLVAGDYKVQLSSAAGTTVVTSKAANLPEGASVKVAWDDCPTPDAAAGSSAASPGAGSPSPAVASGGGGGGGGSLATWLAVGGAVAAGVAIALIASGGDDEPAPRPTPFPTPIPTPTPTPPVSPAR